MLPTTIRKLLILCSVIATMSVSCKKDDVELPSFPANTEVGANTFLFRVDGDNILETQVGFLSTSPKIHIFYNHDDSYFNGDNRFEISGSRINSLENKTISIKIKSLPHDGTYMLSEGNYWAFYDETSPNGSTYYTDVSHFGKLIINKLDTLNHIISGTFKFEAIEYINYNSTSNRTVIIEGQFDVKYMPNKGLNYY